MTATANLFTKFLCISSSLFILYSLLASCSLLLYSTFYDVFFYFQLLYFLYSCFIIFSIIQNNLKYWKIFLNEEQSYMKKMLLHRRNFIFANSSPRKNFPFYWKREILFIVNVKKNSLKYNLCKLKIVSSASVECDDWIYWSVRKDSADYVSQKKEWLFRCGMAEIFKSKEIERIERFCAPWYSRKQKRANKVFAERWRAYTFNLVKPITKSDMHTIWK